MDVERAFVSCALRTKTIARVAEAHVTAEHFTDDISAQAFEWMHEYWSKYSKPPTIRAFRERWPKYALPKVTEPVEYYIDQMKLRRQHGIIETGMLEVVGLLDREGEGIRNVPQVLEILHDTLTEAGGEGSQSSDMDLNADWKVRVRDYRERSRTPGKLLGITTGFRAMDEATSGLQKEQLITFIGEPKSGKSTTLLHMGRMANESGSTVLWIGHEMSNREQYERFDSMVGEVDLRRLQQGLLTVKERKKLRLLLELRADLYPPFTLVADPSGSSTLSAVRAKIEKYAPDIVFVDGVYLMEDEVGHEPPMTPRHLTNLSRGFKRMAQAVKLPMVISTAALSSKVNKKEGLTVNAIGYSSGFAQDSDLVMGTEFCADHPDTPGDPSVVRGIRLVIGRNARPMSVRCTIDWSLGTITEHYVTDWTENFGQTIGSVASLGLVEAAD